MLERFFEWFFSRPKYERVLFYIDLLLFLLLILAVECFLFGPTVNEEVLL